MSDDLYPQIAEVSRLERGWRKVKRNRGGPGIDKVTIEEFDAKLGENLNTLSQELLAGDYAPLPTVKRRIKQSEGKTREIAIPTIRDKVVQQSMLEVLHPLFDPHFSDCSFAYRPGRSPVDAARRVEGLIKEGHLWVFRGDVADFFGALDHERQLVLLGERIGDERVLRLIKRILKTHVLDTMSLREPALGAYQGAPLSPFLANVYADAFDVRMSIEGFRLVRYSDDFCVLDREQERVELARELGAQILGEIHLRLNETKTLICHANEGFVFLGFHYDASGKGPSAKALVALQSRLNEVQGQAKAQRMGVSALLTQLEAVVRGWCNYYGALKGAEMGTPEQALAAARVACNTELRDQAPVLLRRFEPRRIGDPDLACHFGEAARAVGETELSLLWYARAASLDERNEAARQALTVMLGAPPDQTPQLSSLLRTLADDGPTPSASRELAAALTELGNHSLAEVFHHRAAELEPQSVPRQEATDRAPEQPKPAGPQLSDPQLQRYLDLFEGREGCHAVEKIDEKDRRGFVSVDKPLDRQAVQRHLRGEATAGLYLIRANNTVSLAAIDVDLQKKLLLEHAREPEKIAELLRTAQTDADRIVAAAREHEVPLYVEDSGHRGRHCWLFFDRALPAAEARRLCGIVADNAGRPSPGVQWEIFPTQDKVKSGKRGCLIKLPLGVHSKTGQRGLFVDEAGQPVPDQGSFLMQIETLKGATVDRILGRPSRGDLKSKHAPLGSTPTPAGDEPDKERFPLTNKVLEGCRFVRHLADKARDTRYLDHQERLALLSTLGHLGEEGGPFIHKVMSYCMNYDREVTQKWIGKRYDHAMSCGAIRDRYKELTARLGCDCKFRLPARAYPSPILHAVAPDERTRGRAVKPPSPRPSAARRATPSELNALLNRYIQLRKQQKGIARALEECESKLQALFEAAGGNQIETGLGTLGRIVSEGTTRWVIEI